MVDDSVLCKALCSDTHDDMVFDRYAKLIISFKRGVFLLLFYFLFLGLRLYDLSNDIQMVVH